MSRYVTKSGASAPSTPFLWGAPRHLALLLVSILIGLGAVRAGLHPWEQFVVEHIMTVYPATVGVHLIGWFVVQVVMIARWRNELRLLREFLSVVIGLGLLFFVVSIPAGIIEGDGVRVTFLRFLTIEAFFVAGPALQSYLPVWGALFAAKSLLLYRGTSRPKA